MSNKNYLIWWSPVGHRYGEAVGVFRDNASAKEEARRRMLEFNTHGAYGAETLQGAG